MKINKSIYLSCIIFSLFSVSVKAQALTLVQALEIATENDPVLAKIASNVHALKDKAVAETQLPDPKATLAFQNFPVDDFNRTREGMTQIVTGVSQKIPRGRTLKYKGKQTQLMAESVAAEMLLRNAHVKREVRQLWFDFYYWNHAAISIARGETLLQKIIEVTELHYGTGGQNVQDVIGAELELSVLQDKKIDVQRNVDGLKAALAKWVGSELVDRKFNDVFPALPQIGDYKTIEQLLVSHPQVQVVDAMIGSERQGVNIAKEQYKPGFDIGLSYGFRDGTLTNGQDRSDFLTAKLTFDLPLFVKKRQDKQLAASQYKVIASQYQRDDVLRDLRTQLQKSYVNWKRFDQRVRHYDQSVIRYAKENFEASLEAYRDDRTNFASLIRAQVVELDTQLNYLKILLVNDCY